MERTVGQLREVDLAYRRCRIFRPTGGYIQCEFEEDLEPAIKKLLDRHVAVEGIAIGRKKNGEIRALRIRTIERAKAVSKAAKSKPRTGKDFLDRLIETGIAGMWKDRTDIGDSVEFARKLRGRGEKRVWQS